jgi:hypothetical protein
MFGKAEGSSFVTRWLRASTVILLLAGIVAAFVVPAVAVVVSSYGGGPAPMLFYPRELLVDKGVAMVMVCGERPTRAETVNGTAGAVLRYGWTGGGWWSQR